MNFYLTVGHRARGRGGGGALASSPTFLKMMKSH